MLLRAIAGAAACLLMGAVAAPSRAASTGYPTSGCYTVSDRHNDAAVNGGLPSDPDLDLYGVAVQATSQALRAYVRVNKLAAAPTGADGHRFSLQFSFNDHDFEAAGSSFASGTGAVRDGLAASGLVAKTAQLVVDGPQVDDVPPGVDRGFVTSGLKVSFDRTRSFVVFELPARDVVRYSHAPWEGTLTSIVASSATEAWAGSVRVDTTNDDNTTVGGGTQRIGRNSCFPRR